MYITVTGYITLQFIMVHSICTNLPVTILFHAVYIALTKYITYLIFVYKF